MNLIRFGKSISKGLNNISRSISWLSMGFIVLMIAVVIVDVVGHYVFNKPFTGSNDMVELMMVITVFCGLAYCVAMDGNVRVDIIYGRLSKRTQAILDIVNFTGSTFIFILIAWRLGARVWNIIQEPLSGPSTGTLVIPHLPFILLATICSALVCLELIAKLVNAIYLSLNPDNSM